MNSNAGTPQSRIDSAIERCRSNGWKLTPIRRRALEYVCRNERATKAYELLDHVSDEHAVASPMRVYRALEFLTRHGFVRHLKSINAFVWCPESQQIRDTPFLICDQCEATTAIADAEICELIGNRAARFGFEPALHSMEIHGICSKCRAESADTEI